MNYGELRDLFKGILNRTDCTDNEADRFLSLGLRRVERVIRTPLSEHEAQTVVNESGFDHLSVPNDFLSVISLTVDGHALDRVGFKSNLPTGSGQPTVYRMIRGVLELYPTPPPGSIIDLHYYGEMVRPSEDTEVVGYTNIIGDLVVYAALVYAATFFTDERLSSFRSIMAELTQELQNQSDEAQMSGGMVMSNPYAGYC